jgi:cell wall-associated NlpC family hydrolase
MKTFTLWACLLLVSVSFAKTTHTAKSTDNDHWIAKIYGVSVSELRKANPKINWNKLRPGTKVIVPTKDKKSATGSKDSKKTTSKTVVAHPKPNSTHIVGRGDSDWSIARKFGLTVAQLHAMNPGVKFHPLRDGVKVKVYLKPATVAKKVDKAPKAVPQPKVKTVAAKATAPKTNFKEITTINAQIAKSDVIVRSSASTSGGRIATAKKGMVARVMDRKGDWYNLTFAGGVSGWVRYDMLSNTDKQVTPTVLAVVKPKPSQAPKRVASTVATSGNASVSGDALMKTAYGWLGTRYVYGGTSRSGVDCSAFVGAVYRAHGINLPRTSAEQYRRGTPVSRGELRTGDLVFFRTRGGSRVSHVGIYIGDNKFIHASSGGRQVRINALTGYYSQRYVGAKRISSKFTTSSVDYSRYLDNEVEEPSFNEDPLPEPIPAGDTLTRGADTVAD